MLKKQIIKFIFTGVLNTGFYYLLYSFFIYLNFDYRVSVLFATMIGVLFSYKTFGKFVFESDDKESIYRFISVYILLYFINIILIGLFEVYFTNYYISGLVATICCAILSFILNKWYVFKKKEG